MEMHVTTGGLETADGLASLLLEMGTPELEPSETALNARIERLTETIRDSLDYAEITRCRDELESYWRETDWMYATEVTREELFSR